MIEPTDDNTTERFPVAINPVHVGVYQTRLTGEVPWRDAYSYWNGTTWCLRSATPDLALQNAHVPSKDMVTWRLAPSWRGLREQPK